MRIASASIPRETAIQSVAQNTAGMPVALAMFTASVDALGANGEERKKTVFRSSNAFKTHCTARKLTKKVATRGFANLATATSPIDNSVPARNVNGTPESVPQVKIGESSP